VRRVSFVPADQVRAAAERAFAEHAAAIRALLPAAEIEHVGATSIPGALTKGDLDLLVRVEREGMPAAVDALRGRYAVHQLDNWTGDLASFAYEGESPLPVGVQLVVRGTPDDLMFRDLRGLLLGRPAALERLNALKRSFEGAEYDSYTEAKGALIEGLLDGRIRS
jgi:GrpB-like predicted nucleotidyltransferase (UPF0157 family)